MGRAVAGSAFAVAPLALLMYGRRWSSFDSMGLGRANSCETRAHPTRVQRAPTDRSSAAGADGVSHPPPGGTPLSDINHGRPYAGGCVVTDRA